MIGLARARALRRTVLRSAFDALPTSIAILRGSPHKRRIALTFDAGRDDSTRHYLDSLDRFQVRATFFLVGQQCEARRDDMLEIVRRGHEVAAHGFSHKPF